MAQLISVRLTRPDGCPLGFRLQGGKDFGTPLVIQKVNGGSPADKAGLAAGDSVIKVNNTEVFTLRHKEAQDVIVQAGQNFDITVQRGGGTWKPSVSAVGSLPSPARSMSSISPVTQTSLKANHQPSHNIGSGYNSAAKPFNYMNGNGDSTVKSIVNKQYNTPVGIYSEETIAETLSAQAEVLAGGVLGVNFKKNEKTYDSEKSEVFKMLQEADNDPEPEACAQSPISGAATGLRHVSAPVTRPDAPLNNTGGLPPGQNICEECERLIIGVFVRIKDKNLHVECFKCATCGSSLKNQGYYNLNGKLYCDIHAKMVARQNPPAPNLEPYTVPQNKPSSTFSSVLPSAYSVPLPPLSNPIYSPAGNGPSSLMPSGNISGPRPFGAPLSPAMHSPVSSLSPRSAPGAPVSPASTLPRPSHQFSAPAPTSHSFTVKSVKNIIWPPKNDSENEECPDETNLLSQAVCPTSIPCQVVCPYANLCQATNQADFLPTASSKFPCPSPMAYRTEPAPQMPAPWLIKASRSDPDSTHRVKFLDEVTQENQTSQTSVTSSIQVSSASMIQSSSQSYQQITTGENIVSSSQQSGSSTHCENFNEEENIQTIYQSQTGMPIEKKYETPDKEFQEVIRNDQSESQISSIICTNNEVQNIGHNQSICSTEETYTSGKKSPMECVETISEKINTKQLVQSLTNKCETLCPLSPTLEAKQVKTEDKFNISNNKEHDHIQVQRKESISMTATNKNQSVQGENMQCILSNPTQKHQQNPLLDALTIAPERSYSPLPEATKASTVCSSISEPLTVSSISSQPESTIKNTFIENMVKEVQTINDCSEDTTNKSAVVDSYESKSSFSSISPIKPHTPIQTSSRPVPMPEETIPYFPPDIPINIERRQPRGGAVSPLVSALTIAPSRPYTPLGVQPIERGSFLEALTIAPERPYTPLVNENNNSNKCAESASEVICSKPIAVNTLSKECIRPVATQPCQTVNVQTSKAPIQTVCQFQSSTQLSAFKPVAKTIQTFPPPFPEELLNSQSITTSTSNQFAQASSSTRVQTTSSSMVTESHESSHVQEFQKMEIKQNTNILQNYEQSFDSIQCEQLSVMNKRASSGLQKPSNIPCYQKNLEQLPSQRGKTPEITNEPAILQKPISPCIAPDTIDPHVKKNTTYQQTSEPNRACEGLNIASTQCNLVAEQKKTDIPSVQDLQKDTPISMTFQPVTEATLRVSPTVGSRPTTPSMINKPAPLIPYYQMNLVAVECSPPETNLYEPSSPEVSRSPTPKMIRTRSPAPGPPPNPLKMQAPKIKETTAQAQTSHSLLSQATANLRKEHESVKNNFQSGVEIFNSSGAKNWANNQQSFLKSQHMTKIGFHSQETMDAKISESLQLNHQCVERATQSQSVFEKGTNSVQRTRKVFEEFERTQVAKSIEIQKNAGAITSNPVPQIPNKSSAPSHNYTQQESPRNVQQPQSTLPIVSFRPQTQPEAILSVQPSANTATKPQPICGLPCSITSGANLNTSGPVCDPTPSTGGAGAAARGKTFGVSSAPKRGRGILNMAAGPGSRVALCAHCNGHIRGPFITALGRIWCPEHFVCVNNTCRRHLQDIGFVEENGQLYCEYCFEQFIAPACDKCHGKIKGDCLNAIGKHFHPECFNCAYCGKLFGNNPFFLEEGLPYCEADWNELFTTKCIACGFPVEAGDRWVEALNNNYHSQCFNCTMCKKNLEGQSFYAKGGRPFCKSHAR